MPDGTATIGHNNPPSDAPFDAIRIHCDDLYAEGKHWLDGGEISSDAEADAVTGLLDMARDAAKAADDQRVLENKPFDEGKAAVQVKYAPLIGNTKQVKGSMVRLQEACKAVLEPWRRKKAAEAAAVAEAARREAEETARKAAEAMRSSAGDLEAREAAEAMQSAAEQAQRDAARATRAATTGTGLTTYYEAVMVNSKEAILHYLSSHREEFDTLAQRLADTDVRAGKRQIPGFTVEERKRAR